MKQIVFTDRKKAELLDMPVAALGEHDVLVKTLYSAISTGTETINLLGNPYIPGMRDKLTDQCFPRYLGYSETGIVEKVGEQVALVKPGDRVLCYWGTHSEYQVLPERQVVPLPENVDPLDASFMFIASFPLAAIRKVRVEIGESAMVVGLGILGQFAVKLLRAAGATPVIAVDLSQSRRELALQLGADYALDPSQANYVEQVKQLTGGKGVAAMIEVTGKGEALNQSLRCMAKMGRVALLGCTRQPTTVDFYYDVHLPGVEMYGAHTLARPDVESYPGHWTPRDDCAALLRLLSLNRLTVRDIIAEVHTPQEAPEVYLRMADDRDFPIGVAFDWSKL